MPPASAAAATRAAAAAAAAEGNPSAELHLERAELELSPLGPPLGGECVRAARRLVSDLTAEVTARAAALPRGGAGLRPVHEIIEFCHPRKDLSLARAFAALAGSRVRALVAETPEALAALRAASEAHPLAVDALAPRVALDAAMEQHHLVRTCDKSLVTVPINFLRVHEGYTEAAFRVFGHTLLVRDAGVAADVMRRHFQRAVVTSDGWTFVADGPPAACAEEDVAVIEAMLARDAAIQDLRRAYARLEEIHKARGGLPAAPAPQR